MPQYIHKLIDGYDMRCYAFEIFECARKLLLVGVPVFFEAGGVGQATFGLFICFLSFGIYIAYRPHSDWGNNVLSQLCQVQQHRLFSAHVSGTE